MEHAHPTIPFLREIIVFLVAAGVAVPVLARLRVSPVLGYLVLGGLIGPYGLGLLAAELPALGRIAITDLDGVRALAELGVVFLLFVIGLELSLDRLWAMRRLVFGLGAAQILVCAAAIGAIAAAIGSPAPVAVVLGACLALSSTAIVMQLLMGERRLGTPAGRAAFAILLMQDLAVIPILFMVTALGTGGPGGAIDQLAGALAKAVLVMALLYGIGRLALRPALRTIAQTRSPEAFMAAVLLIVIGTAALTGAAGLSMALGAFLAGLVLAETEYRHQIEVTIEPFKGLMLGLFFMSVGMGIDWRVIGAQPGWIAAAVAGLIVLKAALNTGICLAFRLPRHVAAETGLLLAQGGEFAFVVVGLGLANGVVPAPIGQLVLIVAGLTMLATPFLAGAARRLGQALEQAGAADDARLDGPIDREGHVIIAGFGRVGRLLANVFEAEQLSYVGLDCDAALVASARRERRPIYFGDAGRLEMLARLKLERAAAIVVTMDDAAAAERIVAEIRRHHPEVPVYVRARDEGHAARLRAAGASAAVPETLEGSLQLAGRVLDGMGASDEVVRRRIETQRLIADG